MQASSSEALDEDGRINYRSLNSCVYIIQGGTSCFQLLTVALWQPECRVFFFFFFFSEKDHIRAIVLFFQ